MSESFKNEKILIVDDNRQNIEILMDLFRQDYRVTAAINGERALKIARSESPPDIILLDIIMPDMDGYDVCKILKDDQKTKDIPILFVTAVSEVMDETKGFSLGAVDYITTPFHPPMIKARVDLHLNLMRKHKLLERYAFIDALTEIPNRRRFDEIMGLEWSRAKRSDKPLSLLLLDIDHFKEYNDTYGHGMGDKVLQKLARVMEVGLRRAGDFVARYGGEEFGILLPYTDVGKAREIARNISLGIQELAIDHSSSPTSTHVTVSTGIATLMPGQEAAGMEEFFNMADRALYLAKNSGRNMIETLVMG